MQTNTRKLSLTRQVIGKDTIQVEVYHYKQGGCYVINAKTFEEIPLEGGGMLHRTRIQIGGEKLQTYFTFPCLKYSLKNLQELTENPIVSIALNNAIKNLTNEAY